MKVKTFNELRKGDFIYSIKDYELREYKVSFCNYDRRREDLRIYCDGKDFTVSDWSIGESHHVDLFTDKYMAAAALKEKCKKDIEQKLKIIDALKSIFDKL